MKDRRMERGGVGGNQRSGAKFAAGPKKSGKKYDGMGALDFVKKQIRANMDTVPSWEKAKRKDLTVRHVGKGINLLALRRKAARR